MKSSVVIFQAQETSPASLTSAASTNSLASTASKASFPQKTYCSDGLIITGTENNQYTIQTSDVICECSPWYPF